MANFLKSAPDFVNSPIELKNFQQQPTIEASNILSLKTKNKVSLAWRNLCYEVPERLFSKKKKKVLRSLTGQVKCRSLNGFMGPSGAGKTTLLSCLNGNIQRMTNGTEIYVNIEEKIYPEIAFIEQHVHETIVPRLKIREILYYAFRFKNHHKNLANFDQHVQSILEKLLLDQAILERCFGQCSGGEQKRIALAQELMSLNQPTFLFIDEPTTGLDSEAALLVMRCLRQLTVAYEITLMVSIHMPNDEIIRMFDQLYILAKGGVCIFAGAPNFLRKNLKEQLNVEVLPGQPPIEFYLKLASREMLETDKKSNANDDDNHVLKLVKHTQIEENEKLKPFRKQIRCLNTGMSRRYKRFYFRDFLLQIIRLGYIIFRVEFHSMLIQLFCYIFFYLFMSTVFDHNILNYNDCYSLDYFNTTCKEIITDDTMITYYINYQAISVMFTNLINIIVGTILFSPLLKVFRNEHQNRWYSMSTFYWSFILIRFIELTLFALIITTLIYFSLEHQSIDNYQINWARLCHFGFFIWLSCLYMQSIGQLLAIILLDQMEIALIVAEILFFLVSFTNGYLITIPRMKNALLVFISDVFASKHITNGMLYATYVLDRCDLKTHYSPKSEYYESDLVMIYQNIVYVFINILILRILTFVIIYVRYSLPGICQIKLEPSSDWKTIEIESNQQKQSSLCTLMFEPDRIERKKSNVELEFEKFSRNKIIVGWRNLTLFGSDSIFEMRSTKHITSKTKIILRNLNGQFRFGTLNALMGTSGAGKTSLLKVLNGQLKIRLSNETQIYMSRYTPIRICYLTQEVSGHLWPGMTALESLIYASKLKNCNVKLNEMKENNIKHEKIAHSLLDELDLKNTANTLIQNCSGGEKKRLALALELTALQMPNFICIDEPTSGLDSNSSAIVLNCLRKFVHRHNITIVASVHQPSITLLMLFDYCYVLARGGVCIYSDTVNKISSQLMKISDIDWNSGSNDNDQRYPIEELVKYSCYSYDHPIVKELTRITNEYIISFNSKLFVETQKVPDGIQANRIRFSLISLWLLCVRHLAIIQNFQWIYIAVGSILYIVYGLLNILIFDPKIAFTSGCRKMDEDFFSSCTNSNLTTSTLVEDELNLSSNVRYSLFFNVFFLYMVMFQAAILFSKDLVFFFNEHQNGWYSTGTYYIMKSVYDILQMIPLLFIYVYLINIYEPVRPGIYWSMLWLMFISIISIQSIGHVLTLIIYSNNQNHNWHITKFTFVSISFFFMMTLLANFFNPIHRMHYAYQFMSNFSILRWAHESHMLLQYGFDRCRPREIQIILYLMQIQNDDHFYHSIRMLIFNTIFYRCLSLAILFYKSNPLQNRRERAKQILTFNRDQIKPYEACLPGIGSHMEFRIKLINTNVNRPVLNCPKKDSRISLTSIPDSNVANV